MGHPKYAIREMSRSKRKGSKQVIVDEKDKSGLEDSHDVAAALRHSLPIWAEPLNFSRSLNSKFLPPSSFPSSFLTSSLSLLHPSPLADPRSPGAPSPPSFLVSIQSTSLLHTDPSFLPSILSCTRSVLTTQIDLLLALARGHSGVRR